MTVILCAFDNQGGQVFCLLMSENSVVRKLDRVYTSDLGSAIGNSLATFTGNQ